jgi:hypothetical protein
VINGTQRQLLKKAANEFFELAHEDANRHYENRLIGIKKTLAILGEDDLVNYISDLLNQLTQNREP